MDEHRNPWERVLAEIQRELDSEDFRRWFSSSSYAGDSGDQITVWIETHYQDTLDRALVALNRTNTLIRFVVAGFGDEDDEIDEDDKDRRRV